MKAASSVATVLFTDIVGSTERAAELRDRRWRELLEQHHSLVRRQLKLHHGHEIATAGDGFLALFDSPVRAILCAAAIRDGVRDIGLDVRCGVHMGEVERTDGTVGGIAVHIGSRVAALAGAGEVLVSSTVRDAEAGSEFGFEDRGRHELKGVPGQWRLYALTDVPDRAVAALPKQPRLHLPHRRAALVGVLSAAILAALVGLYAITRDRSPNLSPEEALAVGAAPGIAVLPFSVRGEGLDVWREGMVDLLSTGLDGAAGLRAIDSRTVLARWDEQASGNSPAGLATAMQVARLTGARYALVGSAVAIGPNVRLVADIYEVADGQRLGQGQVEGAPDSVLMLADRLATDVLRVILRKGDGEVPRIDLASVTTASFPALKAYLEGEVLFRRSDFDASIEAYRRAVEADSTFALAYYRLSEAYGWSESIWSESAGEMLERAARLAHRLPERDALFVRASLALHRFTLDGLEPMRQAVRKYPEDPEAWFLLGDTYYHLGQAALVSLEETERALTRAVEIEPRFMPYRIHPVDLAFWHADSALAAQRIDDYQRLAPDAGFAHTSRRAFALAFGDSAVHAQARAGLNTLEVAEIWRLQGYFFHPRHAAERETVLNTTRRRDDVLKTRALIRLFDASMTRGRLQEGLEYLADPMTAADGRVCGVYEVHIRGLPVTDERLESTLAFSEHDTIPRTGMLCIGAYAADRGRWADHSGAVENLRRQAQSALGVGDSAEAGFYAALAQALEGYALWKRGQPDAALRTLTNAQPNASAAALDWLGLTHAEPVRWWLGQLYLELDRPRDAEPYFRSLWWDPLAHYYLGTIYEEQQEFDRARDAYSYFVESWRDADPELRPLVERGRRGLIRVTGVRRE